MSRIENPYMKQYTEEFVIDCLNNCDLFVETFGKKFAQKRLSLNLEKVYTNQKSNFFAGYQQGDKLSITICHSGPNGTLLLPKDLTEAIKETLLHESIHAIFTKTKGECKKNKIKTGTGILTAFNNNTEIGRGLNEGLTEWICEKAGFENNAYFKLTNFVRQIELALGEKEVMKFAGSCSYNVKRKKNSDQNLSQILKMTEQEKNKYLVLADNVYTDENNLAEIYFMLEQLNKKQKEQISDEEFKEKIDEAQNIKDRIFFEEDSEYKEYLNDNNLEDTNSSKIEFLKIIKEQTEKSLCKSVIEFESMTFEHYFSKEFNELKEMNTISDEKYEKFYKLNKYMSGFKKYANEELKVMPSLKFKKEFDEINEKYKESLLCRLQSDMKAKNITAEKYKKYTELLKSSNGGRNIDEDIIKVLEKCEIKNPTETLDLIKELQYNGNLDEAKRYEIVEYGSDTRKDLEKTVIYLKDGVPDANIMSGVKETFSGQDDISDDELFDFTIGLNEDFSLEIQKFLKLKDDYLNQDPNATFTIVNREFIVNSNGESFYYKIENGDIIPIEEIGREKLDFFSDEPEKTTELLAPISKKSFIERTILAIKRRALVNKKEINNYIDSNKEQQTPQDKSNNKSNKFKDSLTISKTDNKFYETKFDTQKEHQYKNKLEYDNEK